MGAAGTSNVAVELRELHQLSLPYIITLKSFVVNFLNKKLSRFFVKLLSRFFRRLLFKFFFFFFSKTMWLVVKTERRWQPRAGAAVRCRNTSNRRKRRVNYEKISLLIVCLFAKFPRQRRVNYTSCMSFCKDSTPSTYQWLCYRASRSSITINVLVVLRQVVGLTQFIVFRYFFV